MSRDAKVIERAKAYITHIDGEDINLGEEMERLRNLWIKTEAQIPPEGSYDELVDLDRLRARCAELEKALRRARETLDCAGYRTTDMKNEIKRIDADLAPYKDKTMADENITDEMLHAVARALYNEEDVKEMSCHPSTFEVIEALWPLIAKAAKAEAPIAACLSAALVATE